MLKILKFPIEIKPKFSLSVPRNAMLMCVMLQNEQPAIWAQVDQSEPDEIRDFILVGDGGTVDNENNATFYVGTFFYSANQSAMHVFEILGIPFLG